MRKIVYSMMMSIDGYIARPDGDISWLLITDELHRFTNESERNFDTHIYGRKLYELMAGYWSTADKDPDSSPEEVDYALTWQAIDEVVFSTTLNEVGDRARLVRGDVAGEAARLKAKPGKHISVGGASIAASFFAHDLIDACQVYVHPVILGNGIPMFATGDWTTNMRLTETQTFESGVVFLNYERATPED